MRATRNAIKKVTAVCLTVIMMLSMTVTALAAEQNALAAAGTETGSLTVNVNDKNTLEGQTIYLYKLFDLSISGTNYTYKVNDKYESILNNILKLDVATPANADYDTTIDKWKDNSTELQTFADDFTAEALKAKLSAEESSGKLGKVNKHVFTDVPYGYYLVYQTGTKEFQSSLVSVDHATENTVNLKGEAPSITKTADKETVEIGQVVTYTITGTIPDTTGYDMYTYIIKDTLTEGLDFVTNVNGDPVVDPNSYAVTVKIDNQKSGSQKNAKLSGDGNRTMTLDLSQWVKENQDVYKGKIFTVTYYAKVNEKAVVTTNNKAELEYGNNSNNTITTTPVQVNTPTYPLQIHKKVKGGSSYLADATFRLYKTEQDAKDKKNPIGVTGSNGSYTVGGTSQTFDMVSVDSALADGNMNLRLNGLAAGDYWLVETEPPKGYNGITAPIQITITQSITEDVNDWKIAKDSTEEVDKIIDIENSTGALLPETGGMGTILFTVVAVAMIAGVVLSFIRSRRDEE